MSNLFSFNPWQEAAAYGAGLGHTLGEAFIQRPAIQAEARQRGLEMQQSQEMMPLQMAHLRASTAALQAQPELRRMALENLYERTQIAQQMADIAGQRNEYQQRYGQSLADLRDAQAEVARLRAAGTLPSNKPAQGVTNSDYNLGRTAAADQAKKLAFEQGIDPKTMPVMVGSDVEDAVAQRGFTPESIRDIVRQGQLLPDRSTNQITHGFKNFFGAGLAPTEEYKTNSMTLHMPASSNQLTPERAAQFLQQANGDKDLARQLARQAGFNF
jgi:hypothetical protein